MESLSELRGTWAWIVLPRWGCDSIRSVPFSNCSSSCMLMRPSPRPSLADWTSKPAPESLTVRSISPGLPHNSTSNWRTALCLQSGRRGPPKHRGGIDRPRVATCGECAPILWEQGKTDAAVEVEHLWDEIAKSCNVDILCGYVLKSFQREHESHIYQRICAKHSAVSSL